MKDVTDKNFGLIIAFLLPGFIFLWGLSYSSTEIASLLAKSGAKDAPTVGGFLYVTIASLALGLVASALRWLIVDHLIHCASGMNKPGIDFTKLRDADRLAGFQAAVENHYRYYQYYSNTLIGIVAALFIHLFYGLQTFEVTIWLIAAALVGTLFLASWDCLSKYYSRARQIVG